MTTTTKRAKYKVCRRLGPGVYEKCQTEKFVLAESRKQKGTRPRRRRTMSDYNRQLLEKQKARFTYGVNEKQFSNYVKVAMKEQGLQTAPRLYMLLESRLDNVVFRLGLAPTRSAARQLVAHGHVLVNGTRVKVPSHQVAENDIIEIREGSQGKAVFENRREDIEKHQTPAWLTYDHKAYQGTVIGVPAFDQTTAVFDLSAVLEFYSR